MSEANLQIEPNLDRAKLLNRLVWVITAAVLLLVGLMRQGPLPVPEWWNVSFLPAFHAILNSIAAAMIIAGGIAAKGRKIDLHRKLMMAALAVSAIFLLSYVTYHFTSAETMFGDSNGDKVVSAEESAEVGATRFVYYGLLISHIAFAAISLPLILFSVVAAITNQLARHRKLVKFAYPMWLYVAVTGPICYFMLRGYYQ